MVAEDHTLLAFAEIPDFDGFVMGAWGEVFMAGMGGYCFDWVLVSFFYPVVGSDLINSEVLLKFVLVILLFHSEFNWYLKAIKIYWRIEDKANSQF